MNSKNSSMSLDTAVHPTLSFENIMVLKSLLIPKEYPISPYQHLTPHRISPLNSSHPVHGHPRNPIPFCYTCFWTAFQTWKLPYKPPCSHISPTLPIHTFLIIFFFNQNLHFCFLNTYHIRSPFTKACFNDGPLLESFIPDILTNIFANHQSTTIFSPLWPLCYHQFLYTLPWSSFCTTISAAHFPCPNSFPGHPYSPLLSPVQVSQ